VMWQGKRTKGKFTSLCTKTYDENKKIGRIMLRFNFGFVSVLTTALEPRKMKVDRLFMTKWENVS
jgi:hypothetical protein